WEGCAEGLRLLQEDTHAHADEHGEEKGGQGADQEVLGELTVLELLEAGEGALEGAHRAAAGDIDRPGGAVFVAPHLECRQFEHAPDQDDAPTRDVEVGRGEKPHPPPPEPIDTRSREGGEERAQDDCRDHEQRFAEEERPAAAATVHLAGPERGSQRVREQRNDEERIHAGSVSRSARNILSPAATRGQAMRRARWEIALRSTSSRAAAAAGSPSRSRVAVRRCRGVQLQYSAE